MRNFTHMRNVSATAITLILSTCATAPAASYTPECVYQQYYTAGIYNALEDAIANDADGVVLRYLEVDLEVAVALEASVCWYGD